MLKEVVIATSNPGKAKEFKELLGDLFGKLVLLSELDSKPNIIEDGDSFRENAFKKARTVLEYAGKVTLADDSGLEVKALGGAPGIYSSRFAGNDATDRDNIDKLLRELSGKSLRQARFVCSIALLFPGGEEIIVDGTCEGEILDEPRGEGGFGYDPVFYIPDMGKTMAELSSEEKNRISHRARAAEALKECLNGKF